MRALRAVVFLLTLGTGAAALASPGEAGRNAICEVNFAGADAPCAPAMGAPIGQVEKSAVVSIGKRIFMVKFDAEGKRAYEEVFEGKPRVLIGEGESALLDEQYDPKADEPVTFHCSVERKSCGIVDAPPSESIVDLCEKKNADKSNGESSITELAGPIEKLAAEESCTKAREIELKQHPCDGRNKRQLAGGCLMNFLKGGLKSLTGTGSFMYGLVVAAASTPLEDYDLISGTGYAAKMEEAADKPAKYIANWWASTEVAENESSDAMDIASHVEKKTLEQAAEELEKEGAEGPSPGLLARFENFMVETLTANYGCLEWSGIPHGKGSRCLKPWSTWACADCGAKANLVCGTLGFLTGEVGSAVLIGGFFKYLTAGGKLILASNGKVIDSVQAMLAMTSKYVPSPKKFSAFSKGVQSASAGITLIGKKLEQGQSMVGDFLMEQLRATGRVFENKLPPPQLGLLASISIKQPALATRWYWQKLELAYAQGVGGAGKRLAVAQEQAESAMEKAEEVLRTLEDKAKNTGETMTNSIENAKADLLVANQRFEKIRSVSDVHDFHNLREEFAGTLIRPQLEQAAKQGKSMSAAEFKRISAEALQAGEEEQAKNLISAFKGIEIINAAPKAAIEELKEKIAPILHESWRSSRKATPEMIDAWISGEAKRMEGLPSVAPGERKLFDAIVADVKEGKYPRFLPRPKPVGGAKVFGEADAVDIANTSYSRLPAYWKKDNQIQGENILSVLIKLKGKDGRIASQAFDKMAAIGSPKDADFLGKVGKMYNQKGGSVMSDNDPLVIAAAREFNKWKARTGTSYATELQAAIIAETLKEISEKKESATEFYNEVLDHKRESGH